MRKKSQRNKKGTNTNKQRNKNEIKTNEQHETDVTNN